MNKQGFIKDGLLGLAVGDALGVPVEFRSRDHLRRFPVTGMKGFGSHNQPPGTWSDDTSLACCLAEALITGIDTKKIAENFVRWRYEKWWTPHGSVFDVGIATNEAIYKLKNGVEPGLAGGRHEDDNGNGSLMRILPLVFVMGSRDEEERFRLTQSISSLTHGHIRSVIACHYYLEFARQIMKGKKKNAIFDSLRISVPFLLRSLSIPSSETERFNRLFDSSFPLLAESSIRSSGYVMSTLEASIWCLLQTDNYAEAVLMAVNLGEDTDTTGAVTGGLAGLYYGSASIPEPWLAALVKRENIEDLANRLESAIAT